MIPKSWTCELNSRFIWNKISKLCIDPKQFDGTQLFSTLLTDGNYRYRTICLVLNTKRNMYLTRTHYNLKDNQSIIIIKLLWWNIVMLMRGLLNRVSASYRGWEGLLNIQLSLLFLFIERYTKLNLYLSCLLQKSVSKSHPTPY